jgi:hypothetical protein
MSAWKAKLSIPSEHPQLVEQFHRLSGQRYFMGNTHFHAAAVLGSYPEILNVDLASRKVNKNRQIDFSKKNVSYVKFDVLYCLVGTVLLSTTVEGSQQTVWIA